jgi:hypothetical protein
MASWEQYDLLLRVGHVQQSYLGILGHYLHGLERIEYALQHPGS